MHEESCFVTLTYDQESLPEGGNLVPGDLQLFMKRFRKNMKKEMGVDGIRFYACGEYGEQTWRPHYHLNLFGCFAGVEDIVSRSWSQGFVTVGDFNIRTAQYVAKYVTKGLTTPGFARLQGRHPEFSRQSNRPGIGAEATAVISAALQSEEGRKEIQRLEDVPWKLTQGKNKSMALGRYLRERLRKEVGFTEEQIEEIKQRFFWQSSAETGYMLEMSISKGEAKSSAKLVAEENQGAVASIEARHKISQSKRTKI